MFTQTDRLVKNGSQSIRVWNHSAGQRRWAAVRRLPLLCDSCQEEELEIVQNRLVFNQAARREKVTFLYSIYISLSENICEIRGNLGSVDEQWHLSGQTLAAIGCPVSPWKTLEWLLNGGACSNCSRMFTFFWRRCPLWHSIPRVFWHFSGGWSCRWREEPWGFQVTALLATAVTVLCHMLRKRPQDNMQKSCLTRNLNVKTWYMDIITRNLHSGGAAAAPPPPPAPAPPVRGLVFDLGNPWDLPLWATMYLWLTIANLTTRVWQSNNPHLAGGEQPSPDRRAEFVFNFCNASNKCVFRVFWYSLIFAKFKAFLIRIWSKLRAEPFQKFAARIF